MTLLLLLAIGVTMVVAGRDRQLAEGSDGGGSWPPAETVPEPRALETLAIDDIDGAVQQALAASGAEMDSTLGVRADTGQVAAEVSPASDPDDPVWYITGSRVNLRSGPSTGDPVVGQAWAGQTALVLDRTENGWALIRIDDTGQDAFVYDRFLGTERPG